MPSPKPSRYVHSGLMDCDARSDLLRICHPLRRITFNMRESVTTARKPGAIALLALLTLVTAWTIYQVPSWHGALGDPCRLASIGAAVTAVFLWATLMLGGRTIQSESIWLAVFLAAMPLVYVSRYLYAVQTNEGGSWLWLELSSVPIYAVLAWLGVRRSPWFLAAGIVLHGLGWDAWHYRHSTYIPDWYATGCLLVDLALAAYVAMRVAALRGVRSMSDEVRLKRIRGAA